LLPFELLSRRIVARKRFIDLFICGYHFISE